jgi:N-acetyl-1-D-myo-inositol-2-amino-2-deoxy-alpha-D-glucopyranoside deacetylase
MAATHEDHPSGGPIAGVGQRLVAIVAHPGDETFGCGSLVAQAAGEGAHVTVICATRGEQVARIPHTPTDHRPIAEVREAELFDAATALGVDEIVVLGHLDLDPEPDPDGEPGEGARCAPAVDDLAAELQALLAERAPDVVLVLDGSDGRRDNRHLRAAVEVAVASSTPRPRLVLAAVAAGLMRRWVAEVPTWHPGTAGSEVDVAQLGRPDDQLLAIDVASWLAIRERAIACHRSQRSPFEGVSPELRRALLATAHVQRAAATD